LLRFRCLWAALTAIACIAAGAAHAQPAAAGLAADPALLRWDPAIRYGQLPNGLRYAVQRNGAPKGGVSLRLGIAVGSYDETDEERGAAHLIEHMAYDGTRSFPPHQLDLIFAPLHVTFGPDRNATSDLKQTVYQLDLPSTDTSEMETATRWLRDVAEGLTFTEPALARERGVIEAERVSRANILRVLRDRMDAFEDGSLRSNARYPLGTKDSIAAMTPARLQAFYDRWYRPENASVTLVGDLPLDVLEQKVKATFGDWTPRGPAGVRAPRTPPATQRGLEIQVETNPGLPAVSGICRVTPADPDASPDDRLHALLLRGLWEAILQQRIAVVRSRRDVPFQEATISDEARPDSLKTCVGIVPVNGQELRAIAIIQTELLRFAAEGPTEDETDAGLEQVRASVRGAIAGGVHASHDRATEVLDRAIDRMPQLAPREGLRAFDVLMEDTTSATVRAAFAKDWGGWGPIVVMTSPRPLSEAAVRTAMAGDKTAAAQ
jgi:zinc protease